MPSQKLDAKSIWDTDGSKKVRTDEANLISAGVFGTIRGSSRSVNHRGSDAKRIVDGALSKRDNSFCKITVLFIKEALLSCAGTSQNGY